MSAPHRQSVTRRGFLAGMAAVSAAAGSFALSVGGASAATPLASTGTVPPRTDAPSPYPETDLLARTPQTIRGSSMLNQMTSDSIRLAAPEGPLSVFGAPNLPSGFTDTFTSQFVDTGEVRLHAVIGGFGPPLLLIHGWPGSWYYWRLVMPALARDFTVIAVDQRGIGLSDKPEEGYDTGTLANDLVGLMDALGHQQFAVVGVDTGMLIGYALAADHPDRVVRLAVGEAPLPGITPPNPLILPDQVVDRLWHIPFNQLKETNEKLVRGREDIFFGAEFAASAGPKKLPGDTVQYYVDGLASSPEALHGSFQLYRAFGATTAQNLERKTRRLPMPVLAMGGALSSGAMVADTMQLTADDVQTLVIPGIGHWLAEEAPEELLAALTAFLAPYRDGQLIAY
jgi:pimeloyl-ACP methyl ester carboxylesterase